MLLSARPAPLECEAWCFFVVFVPFVLSTTICATIAGRRHGTMISQKARSGVAPRSSAASSIAGSSRSRQLDEKAR